MLLFGFKWKNCSLFWHTLNSWDVYQRILRLGAHKQLQLLLGRTSWMQWSTAPFGNIFYALLNPKIALFYIWSFFVQSKSPTPTTWCRHIDIARVHRSFGTDGLDLSATVTSLCGSTKSVRHLVNYSLSYALFASLSVPEALLWRPGRHVPTKIFFSSAPHPALAQGCSYQYFLGEGVKTFCLNCNCKKSHPFQKSTWCHCCILKT